MVRLQKKIIFKEYLKNKRTQYTHEQVAALPLSPALDPPEGLPTLTAEWVLPSDQFLEHV